jgi:twinkle protein
LKKGKTIGHEFFDDKISFETKRLCVVTGVPSSGKSEFIDEICVRLCLLYGWRTVFFSPENMPLSYHASKLMMKITGCRFGKGQMDYDIFQEAEEFVADNFFHILPPESYTIDCILDLARVQIMRKGVRIVVIDPYNRLESQQGSKSETQYISEVLDKLTNFAQQHDVLVILMAHPRKVQDESGKPRVPSLYDINGSANFYNKADYGIVVHRYKGTELTEQYTQVNVDKVKFRHLGEGGKCYFKFNSKNGRYVDYDRDNNQTDYFKWDNSNYLHSNLLDDPKEELMKPLNSELINQIKEFESEVLDEVPF